MMVAKYLKQYLYNFTNFKSTLRSILLWVCIFYLPFTILTLLYNWVVFFQLDHLYQFSTLVFDFRNRIYQFDFSTWDYKNALGYDYFANFYYIPLDITLLPFFIFPFLSANQLLWLSFLMKILIGTSLFAYLLKEYQLKNKAIFYATIIYGTSDLFFAQNVFPTYTGLIMYIPLMLIGVEWLLKRNRYLIFSLIIFQVFLFSYYWAWPLSLFMAMALIIRYMMLYLCRESFNHFQAQLKTRIKAQTRKLLIPFDFIFYSIITFFKSIKPLIKAFLYYLLGMGLASFLLFPIVGIMTNEPRLDNTWYLNLNQGLNFPLVVYLKMLFKLLVPNLYAYSGWFYDNSQSYFLPTNHIILYASILASCTIFHLYLIRPSKISTLTPNKRKSFHYLQIITLLTLTLMALPFVAMLFSLSSSPYLRWYVFAGTLFIINFAFLYDQGLLNDKVLISFSFASAGYLLFSYFYNQSRENPSSFYRTDEKITLTFIVIYLSIVILWLILKLLKQSFYIDYIILLERAAQIFLICIIMVSSYYTNLFNNYFLYAKGINDYYETINDLNQYHYRLDFTFSHYYDIKPVSNLAYLSPVGQYNNSNIFHSLINPYFSYYRSNRSHSRSYNNMDLYYLYYLYLDPEYFTISNSYFSPYRQNLQAPDSEVVYSFDVGEGMYLNIFKRSPSLSLGVGFNHIYRWDSNDRFPYLWLSNLYIQDRNLYQKLSDMGFTYQDYKLKDFQISVNYDRDLASQITFPDLNLKKYQTWSIPTNISREDTSTLIFDISAVQLIFVRDFEDNLHRCYKAFCFVPEAGVKEVIALFDAERPVVPGNLIISGIHDQLVEEMMTNLQKTMATDIVINKHKITSKVTNTSPIIMNYKIGYAKGWQVYVDGEKVETFPAHGGLLSFVIENVGEHEISMTYETPYFKLGIVGSLVSGVIFIGIIFFKYIRDQKFKAQVKDLLQAEKTGEFIRFFLVGVFATIVHYGVYYVFNLKLDKTFAYSLGYGISFICNYVLTNRFTFKTPISKTNLVGFICAHGINYTVQITLLNLFVYFGVGEAFAPIPVFIIAIPLNFLTVRFFIKYFKVN